MGKGLLFFCCACCILVLTIVNLSIGPVISGVVGGDIVFTKPWGLVNCKKLKDDYDDAQGLTEAQEKDHETQIDYCTRIKGMHDMEYTAFIFDIVIGFVCGLIGLLHLFDLKKDFVSNTGLIGLICGIVGFVLTFVYVIFNGIVFTGQYSDEYERDGDGIFAEVQNDGSYKCLYGDNSGDHFAGRAKFSDLNKKQYNYKHKFYEGVTTNCVDDDNKWMICCANQEKITSCSTKTLPTTGTCGKLYAEEI